MTYNQSLTDSFYYLHRYILISINAQIKMCPKIQRFSKKKTHDIPMLIIDIFLYCVKYNFFKSRPSKKKRKKKEKTLASACWACGNPTYCTV